MNKYLITAVLSLLSLMAWQSKRISNLKEENITLDANQSALLGQVETYKTKHGLSVASVQKLNLEFSKYKEYRQEDFELIEKLRLDLKRVQAVSTSETKTIYRIKEVVKDSLIYVDSLRVDTVKIVQYKDDWLDFKGSIFSDNRFEGKIISRESLVYIEHIEPKKFLFFRFGVKKRKQEIVSKNPNTEIVSTEFIKIIDR